jgi:hypothetical protein
MLGEVQSPPVCPFPPRRVPARVRFSSLFFFAGPELYWQIDVWRGRAAQGTVRTVRVAEAIAGEGEIR